MRVPRGPTVTRASSFFRNEDVFWVVEIGVWAHLNGIDDLFMKKKVLWVKGRREWTEGCSDRRLPDRKRRLFDLIFLDYWRYIPLGCRQD